MKRAPKSLLKVAVLENADPIAWETEAIQNQIRQRAFELSQTRPHDVHQRYDWMTAEAEVVSVPPALLLEKDGGFELKFAVAGAAVADINLMVSPQQILLKSELKPEPAAEGGVVHFSDFKPSTVFRSVDLPQSIDVKSVKAGIKDGMIVVTAMKADAEKTKRPTQAARPRKAPAKKSQARMP
jgi:HSP20 family molecular chaperone IbpA